MKPKYVSSIQVPAIAAPSGWVRTAMTIHISTTTPPWMVRIIRDLQAK